MSGVKRSKRPPASRQPRSVADRPNAVSLLLRRQKHLVRPAVTGAVFLLALMTGMAALRSVHSASASMLQAMQDRIGQVAGMRVENVVVQGRANTPEPLLQAAIGVAPGDPIFSFSVEQARDRIESLSWVQNVSVERRLPGTVLVNLIEKRPFAIWQHGGKFKLIDRNGGVVTNEDVSSFGNLPLVVGMGAPRHAAEILDRLAQAPALQTRVVALVRVGDRRWNLRLSSGADVMLPEGAEAAAIIRLMQLQASDGLLDRPLSAIDMRLPDRLILHPATERSDQHAQTIGESPAIPHSEARGIKKQLPRMVPLAFEPGKRST